MSLTRRMHEAHQQASKLPRPSEDALAHSMKLQQHIMRVIASAGGQIPFLEFMELALYTPGLGYYSAGSQKLGREGDFITAPELSPLFSRCLARAIQPLLKTIPDSKILEVGAGSGVMAGEMMAELSKLRTCPQEYVILERSADLIQRQQHTIQKLIPQLENKFSWLDQMPEQFCGVVVANELLDALPVHRLIYQQGKWLELYVKISQNKFTWHIDELSDARLAARTQDILERVGELPDGYMTEVNLAAEDWLRSLLSGIQSAVVLLIDYGQVRNVYYHPQRVDGTLLCHYRHQAHDDVFAFLGLQDITAHIDFTAIADVALECHCQVNTYTTQAHFLLGNGITGLNEETNDAASQLDFANQIKKLTLPQEMGETFKVMLISKNVRIPDDGVKLRDMRDAL